MKKAGIFVIIIILILGGCGRGETNKSKEPGPSLSFPPTASSTPDAEKPTGLPLPDYFEEVDALRIYQPVYAGGVYYMLSDWQDYIREKFGIDIFVYHRSDYLREAHGNTVRYLSNPDDMFFGYNANVLTDCNEESSYELTPYYEKYGWYEYIDQDYISALTVGGEIYAVPAEGGRYIMPRFYNRQYLEASGVDVPETVLDFYDFLKKAKQQKAGDASFFPMCFPLRYTTKATSDIFRAYGVYVNTEFNSMASYNPSTGSFEDSTFSENIVPALEMIRTLQTEDLLSIIGQGFSNSTGVFSEDIYSLDKNFATEYMSVYRPERNNFIHGKSLVPDYEYEKGYFLSGPNTENICEVRNELGFYVFPKDINNINGVVDIFNRVLSDRSLYPDFHYGIMGIDYTIEDDRLVLNPPAMGTFVDLRLIRPAAEQDSTKISDAERFLGTLNAEQWFEKNVLNGMTLYSHEDKTIKVDLNNHYFEVLFNKNISVVDAIDEYIAEFRKTGRLAAIDKLNKRIGAATAYDYGE
ncbi:MAG: extracellular solute-binding protein [Clostridia bacterium]